MNLIDKAFNNLRYFRFAWLEGNGLGDTGDVPKFVCSAIGELVAEGRSNPIGFDGVSRRDLTRSTGKPLQTLRTSMELERARLRLVLQSTEEVLARIRALSPADQAEVSAEWLARLRAAPSPSPWTHGFAMVHGTRGDVIGSCGYRAPPGPDGIVEIAYEVDEDQRGLGYATEAAGALTRYAFETGQVRVVCAHTRAEENASTRVLTRCGFRCVGEVNDPEDGLVWRWERTGVEQAD